MTTSKWLRELGAVRPMAPVGHEVLVLGKWHEGYYPIEWTRCWAKQGQGFVEQWRIFGFLTHETVTREDCERILRSLAK